MYKRSAGLVFSAGVLAIVILGCSSMPDGADPSPSVLGHSSSALYSSGDCPAGSNVIVGTFGDDTIVGTNGNDCILGLDGNDIIHGGNGSDVLWGGPGNDTLYGDNGNDAIYGEEGEDVIQGNNGNDVIFGGPGSDIISGGNGNDSLDGEGGNDVITGNNGNDTLSGGYGNDMLMGSNGNDSFDGGDGLDDCAGAGVRCEPLAAPSSCSSGATCGLGQRCLPDVGVCVSCLADSDCSVACVPMIGCSAVSCPAAQPYVDVDGWYDGPYFGANGSVGGIYPVFGQSFVANANGRLAGVSFRGGRSADISQVHVSVYEFDPASGMSGANIGGRNFDVSGASLLLEDLPTNSSRSAGEKCWLVGATLQPSRRSTQGGLEDSSSSRATRSGHPVECGSKSLIMPCGKRLVLKIRPSGSGYSRISSPTRGNCRRWGEVRRVNRAFPR